MKCGSENPELGEVGRERNEHTRGQGGGTRCIEVCGYESPGWLRRPPGIPSPPRVHMVHLPARLWAIRNRAVNDYHH